MGPWSDYVQAMPKLLIIIGSTRPGRQGERVASWFTTQAQTHGGFDIDVADLNQLDLPLLDEPNHPRLQDYTQDHTRAWSTQVGAADVLVFVTPEYNHSMPASVKNAIDYLHNEWRHKAVGIVSYGGIAGGTRAVTALEPVLSALTMYPAQNLVNIPFFTRFIDGAGTFIGDEGTDGAAQAMLRELTELDSALSALR
jgi:NAD(P)H-dependent FMN reductase